MIFLIFFAHNIDCVYTLEPPRRDDFNEYPQSMFWIKNKKTYSPVHPSFTVQKVGFKRIYISRTCFSAGQVHQAKIIPNCEVV